MSDESIESAENEQPSEHPDTAAVPTPEAPTAAIPAPAAPADVAGPATPATPAAPATPVSDAAVPAEPSAVTEAVAPVTPEPATLPLDPVTPVSGTPASSEAATPIDPVTPVTPMAPVTPEPTAVPVGGAVGGAYALGALSGNPNLGAPTGPAYGAPAIGQAPPTWTPPIQPTPAKTGTHRLRNVVAVTGAVVIALAAGAGISHAAWKSDSSNVSALPPSSASHSFSGGNAGGGQSGSGSFGSPFGSGNSGNSGSAGGAGPSDVSAIAAKVDPALVDINTTLGYQSEQAAGTGIVITSSGEILTNNHVIDGATTISATDVGNGKTYSASVVGYDRTSDIAVLQLHNASGLQTANIDTSEKASVGENVVGIGNAGGTGGTPSAAGGTVTALNQSITASDEGDGSSEQLTGLIQTNANIQPGDSGGSLVNTDGQVIGIDTAASAGFSFQGSDQGSGNQGYAIPIAQAAALAGKIELGQSSSTIHIGATAFLGVQVTASSDSSGDGSGDGSGGLGGGFGGFGDGSGDGSGGFGDGSSGFGDGSGNSGSGQSAAGISIAEVVTSSPAQEAGLAAGDTITTVNGKTVTTPTDLTNEIEPDHPGDKITLGWTDTSGQTHSATIQLTSGPPQ